MTNVERILDVIAYMLVSLIPVLILMPIGNMKDMPLYPYRWIMFMVIYMLYLGINILHSKIDTLNEEIERLYNEINSLKENYRK